jgi:dCTP deaminase
MLLTDRQIHGLLCDDSVPLIRPWDHKHIQPVSYDLHLGGWQESRDWVRSHEFVLGSTEEVIELPHNIAGMVMGVSTVGRTGLIVEMAGLIDPGFRGQITLELYNAQIHALPLVRGMRIAQIVFHRLDHVVEKPYDGRYQSQMGPTPPRPEKS